MEVNGKRGTCEASAREFLHSRDRALPERAHGDKDEVSRAVLRMDSLPGVGERQGHRREGRRTGAEMLPNKCRLQEQNTILGQFPAHTLVNTSIIFLKIINILYKSVQRFRYNDD